MLQTVFLRVLEMSKVAAVVIAVVLAARLALKRAPKAFSYALWAVVLFRLLCPVSVQAPVSVLPRSEPLTAALTRTEEPAAVWKTEGGAAEGGLVIPGAETEEAGAADGAASPGQWDWTRPGQYVWLAGAAGMLLYGAVSCAALRRKLAGAVLLRDNIYLTDRVGSPFVLGLLRPRIYLPSDLEERERPYIILHEQIHIRRLDHIAKPAAFAALCLHWFNPLVWAAFVCFARDMEMSCDEAVVKKLGAEVRADYAASLLRLAAPLRTAAPAAFGEGDAKGRIRNLQRWK
ncbi:MAG: M56 family metallopeptidase [Oscillospiraceae bacterium]